MLRAWPQALSSSMNVKLAPSWPAPPCTRYSTSTFWKLKRHLLERVPVVHRLRRSTDATRAFSSVMVK